MRKENYLDNKNYVHIIYNLINHNKEILKDKLFIKILMNYHIIINIIYIITLLDLI